MEGDVTAAVVFLSSNIDTPNNQQPRLALIQVGQVGQLLASVSLYPPSNHGASDAQAKSAPTRVRCGRKLPGLYSEG